LKNQFDPPLMPSDFFLRHLDNISETQRSEINHAKQDQPNKAGYRGVP